MTTELVPPDPRRPRKYTQWPGLGRVCRAGLATRGECQLSPEAVVEAVDAGINYLNWCNHPDGMSTAIRRLVRHRHRIAVAVQLEARNAADARREIAYFLRELGTDYIDIVTYYYVESQEEWDDLHRPDGAAAVVDEAKAKGVIRAVGLTTHQRPLAAAIVQRGGTDMLMVRYNAAHPGPETEVFPVAQARQIPVVTYTGLRWGALLRPTPADPPGFAPPPPPDWYRYVLCHPAVAVGLMAPTTDDELRHDLEVLHPWRGLTRRQYAAMRAHGARVHAHAGPFP